MCGICGIVRFNSDPIDKRLIQGMMATMKHRGPDDEGFYIDKNIGLGHVRLSVIDLSAMGQQPMKSDDGNYVIVYNGEVYNYLEIKQELSDKYAFKTKTDTEVVLNSYRYWGKDCLNQFNGMFAFALYNNKENELFLARDRFGVKPLYYYSDEDKFIFASEIQPILKILDSKPIQNEQSIYDFLVYNRTNHTENTFFDRIKKLQHGCILSIKNNNIKIKHWYNLSERLKTSFENPEELKELLSSSVKLRLRSDVPLGVCLSGGLDSSSIASIVRNHLNSTNINTFSAVYGEGAKGDESYYIKQHKELIDNMHFVKPTCETFLNDINSFVAAMQEPVPSTSAYAEYKVYELAKDFATVVLSGQGADEEMGGYLYFFGFLYKELLFKLRLIKLLNEIYYDIKYHKSIEGPASFIYFMLPPFLKDKVSLLANDYIKGEFGAQFKGDKSFLVNLYGSKTLHEALVNHFEYKFEHHLIWGDRSSAKFSLEVRYPFLDCRFVEKALCLKNNQILDKGVTKKILRQSMQNIVPDAIIRRMDKVGYETPEDQWFREKKMIELVYDIIHSTSFRNRGYIDAKKADRLYQKHLKKKVNISTHIWKWVNLEMWFNKFFDN